jgi:putative proteasome-type protease
MTYCVAVKLNAGLVFLSDSRTNAGLDQISTFRKAMVYEQPGDRFITLLSAGNLSVSQSVREILQTHELQDHKGEPPTTIWNATSMFDVARVLGDAIRHVFHRDGDALKAAGVDFNVSMLLGGQVKGEAMRLFQVYSPGNFIEATADTPFFQIGESKYGKPVLDRVLTPSTSLADAAKCVLVSMDSTLKSNLSVGLPLDMVIYKAGELQSQTVLCIDEQNPYFQMLRNSWGDSLRAAFDSLEQPDWSRQPSEDNPLRSTRNATMALKKITTPAEKNI